MNKKDKLIGVFDAIVNQYNRITVPRETVIKFGIKPGDIVTLKVIQIVKVSENEVIDLEDIKNEDKK